MAKRELKRLSGDYVKRTYRILSGASQEIGYHLGIDGR